MHVPGLSPSIPTHWFLSPNFGKHRSLGEGDPLILGCGGRSPWSFTNAPTAQATPQIHRIRLSVSVHEGDSLPGEPAALSSKRPPSFQPADLAGLLAYFL